jgi:hypothetical protein
VEVLLTEPGQLGVGMDATAPDRRGEVVHLADEEALAVVG